MPLTDIQIKRLKPQEKDFFISDEKGLRLLVKVNGKKYWRLKYRFNGKQKTLALGVYPEVSLKDARNRRDEARKLLSDDIDPSEYKKEKKQQAIVNESNRFSVYAKQWWEHQKGTWSDVHANKLLRRLKDNCFDYLDQKPADQLKTKDILFVIKQIEQRGALDVASRVLQDINRIFSYAISHGMLEINPARELTNDVIQARKVEHRPSMKSSELGLFLKELEEYDKKGRILTKLALKMLVYTFVRSGELRGARWSEFNLKQKVWRIPEERMKMKTEHIVPLSKQVLKIIKQLKEISGQYELVFPSEKNRKQPMSDNTMRHALQKRLGWDGTKDGKSKAVPHGFRANASSILNEQGFNPDAIERQLSHMERDGVRAAYTHHARYLGEREKMMQWWADFLDSERKKIKK